MGYAVPIPGRGCPRRLYSVRLDLDRVGQVHGSSHSLADDQVLAVLDIACEDARLLPIETPCVFHGNDVVVAGNHSPQYKRAIEVTLVPPEQFDMRLRAFGHKRDHNAGHRFVLLWNGT